MKTAVKTYKPKLSGESRDALTDLARDLAFYADQPGMHYGNPSPGQLLDALAAAYRTNPTAVAAALRALAVTGNGPPPARP